MNISAKTAAELIDALRALAGSGSLGEIPSRVVANVFRNAGIPPLAKCEGEAHEDPSVDNCTICAPRWGAVGEAVTVARSKP